VQDEKPVCDMEPKGTDLNRRGQKFVEKDEAYVSYAIFMYNFVKLSVWEDNGKIKGAFSNPSKTMCCYYQ
jgi:hypothetical protein